MGWALACVAETAFRSWLPLALFCVRGRSAGVCALGLSLRTPGFPSLVAEDGHRTQLPWLSEPPSWAHRGDGHSAFSGPALPQRGKEEQVLRVRTRRPANMGGWRRCPPRAACGRSQFPGGGNDAGAACGQGRARGVPAWEGPREPRPRSRQVWRGRQSTHSCGVGTLHFLSRKRAGGHSALDPGRGWAPGTGTRTCAVEPLGEFRCFGSLVPELCEVEARVLSWCCVGAGVWEAPAGPLPSAPCRFP